MKLNLAAAALLFATLLMAGSARATIVELKCHSLILREAPGLNKVALDGPVVGPALKQRCSVGDGDGGEDVQIEYFSDVHLTGSGICESAAYDADRKPTGQILRLITNKPCPVQSYEKYIQSAAISDSRFLSVIRYWNALRDGRPFSSEAILNRLPTQEYAAATARMLEHLRVDLREPRMRLTSIEPAQFLDRVRLTAAEKQVRAYTLFTDHCFDITVIAVSNGFEIVAVDCPIP